MWLRTTSCRVFADSFKPLLPSPYLSSTPSPVVTLCLSPTPALLNLGTECPPLITQNVNIKLQYLKQTRSLNTRGLMITEKKRPPQHTHAHPQKWTRSLQSSTARVPSWRFPCRCVARPGLRDASHRARRDRTRFRGAAARTVLWLR